MQRFYVRLLLPFPCIGSSPFLDWQVRYSHHLYVGCTDSSSQSLITLYWRHHAIDSDTKLRLKDTEPISRHSQRSLWSLSLLSAGVWSFSRYTRDLQHSCPFTFILNFILVPKFLHEEFQRKIISISQIQPTCSLPTPPLGKERMDKCKFDRKTCHECN